MEVTLKYELMVCEKVKWECLFIFLTQLYFASGGAKTGAKNLCALAGV